MEKKRTPWSWIPTLYFAEGIPYIIVMFVASDMYKTMGVSNSSLAFWTSILYLPWVVKPFWSPFVDMFSTKRKWIFWMQIILAVSFLGVAFSLHLPWWFPITLMFLWAMAITSATHDIAADGFYMLALSEKKQAFFTGIRSTFYRLAMIVGLGLLVIITGLILDNTGLESKRLVIKAVPSNEVAIDSGKKEMEEYLSSAKMNVADKPEILVFPKEINVPLSNADSKLDSVNIYFVLNNIPNEDEAVKMNFGQKDGSKDIYLAGKSLFIFDKTNWNKPQMTTIKVKQNLKNIAEARFDAKAGNVPLAWSISIGTLSLLFLLLALYHRFFLPYPASDVKAEKGENMSFGEMLLSFFTLERILIIVGSIILFYVLDLKFSNTMSGVFSFLALVLGINRRNIFSLFTANAKKEKRKEGSYGEILSSFFTLEGIVPAIAFLLLYRFSESQLTKMASPFMLDARENGGLAMSLTEKGFAYGTVGVLALVVGGISGGILASRYGLKKWIWWMALAINLPNVVYIFMSYTQPSDLLTINSMIAVEQFGYGFGFTGYMLYMLYLASKSKYKTAHFAIATGFMAAGMMLPGMISGWVQELLGYQHFFIYVIICTIPSFIALWFVNKTLDPTFGLKEE